MSDVWGTSAIVLALITIIKLHDFCFVLLEKCDVDEALEATALSPSLRFRLRLEPDELDPAEEGTPRWHHRRSRKGIK